MQNFVIDQQTDAFNKLKNMELSSEVEQEQMEKAFSTWDMISIWLSLFMKSK
ncbi:hypothetical protein [Jeotgalibacillus marinus]|uniref:Uncharacterized protein n=1 Tax=Jeotgalibacillus marinus TaxID=86667 RepID=A0ABV3Q2X2_9BACL